MIADFRPGQKPEICAGLCQLQCIVICFLNHQDICFLRCAVIEVDDILIEQTDTP